MRQVGEAKRRRSRCGARPQRHDPRFQTANAASTHFSQGEAPNEHSNTLRGASAREKEQRAAAVPSTGGCGRYRASAEPSADTRGTVPSGRHQFARRRPRGTRRARSWRHHQPFCADFAPPRTQMCARTPPDARGVLKTLPFPSPFPPSFSFFLLFRSHTIGILPQGKENNCKVQQSRQPIKRLA